MIRVLIADDHAVIRQGLRQILADTPDISITGEASDGHEVLDRLRDQSFDVVVLDISMPGMGGLEALFRLKEEYPDLPVLVLSIHPENQYAGRALRLGASGYMTKQAAPRRFEGAIRKVASGGVYVSPEYAELLAADPRQRRDSRVDETLSNREREVVMKIVAGSSLSEIARQLGLGGTSVSSYRARALAKLGLKNDAELIRHVICREAKE